MINYTFIIPHHNSPLLLNRCIDSIPQRDDIEIIVVDDNSQDDLKPVNLRKGIKVLNIGKNETKGAGKARNKGLAIATGRWLLFADCDDFYSDGFIDVLDQYINKDIDLVFFNVKTAFDVSTGKTIWPQKYSNYIEAYCKNPTSILKKKMVMHSTQAPWNFMVKRSLVEKEKIFFEEREKGNDAYFHHLLAIKSQRSIIINDFVYYWVWNSNSITHKKTTKERAWESIKHASYIDGFRIQADAWCTIKPFFFSFNKISKDIGIKDALLLYWKKLFVGTPWLKVWFHKLVDRFIIK